VYIYAGAASWISGTSDYPAGIFRRPVAGGPWESVGKGLPEKAEVRAIAAHPHDPTVMYAGTQDGPYRSTDGGASWQRLGFPDPAMVVWSFLFRPGDPRTMYLGTSPAAVYRSRDGGDTWQRLSGMKPAPRIEMGFPLRVIRLAADPSRPDDVYAGLEVGGVMRSADGGDTWTDCSAELVRLAQRPHLKSRIGSDSENEGMLDSHALCLSAAAPGTVFLAVRMGLFRSADRGATWEDLEIGRFSPLTYARDIKVAPSDPRVLYSCLSPAARSEDGSLYRSDDLGQSWRRFDHGVKAQSTMMAVALDPRNPDNVFCASRSGQVFGTRDGGRTWEETPLPPGIQDTYALSCG
jgi:photosystem II stability/assembly factor-like uncharacterized protein